MVRRSTLAWLLFALAGLLPAGPVGGLGWAAGPVSERQLAVWRARFQQALTALEQGQEQTFLRLERGLQSYSLAPYLRFAWLSSRLEVTPPATVEAFVRAQQGAPLGERLRRAWLRTLAKRGDWAPFLRAYAGRQSTALRCYKARAELAQLGNRAPPRRLLDDIEALYLVGRSQPTACDAAFKALEQFGRLDDALLWKRIGLAMENGQTSLATYLQKSLKSAARRRWVDRWLALRRDPAKVLGAQQWSDGSAARQVLGYGLLRLADLDAAAAKRHWQDLRGRYAWTVRRRDAVDAAIALHAALQRLPQAYTWLSALKNPGDSERAWRVRAALQQRDWPAVVDSIDDLAATQRRQDHWRYWRARALEALGRPGAEAIYAGVAAGRGYHSFLAADRLGRRYRFNDQPLTTTPGQRQAIAAIPGVRRARELLRLQRRWEARSEWRAATAGLSKAQLSAAAGLADAWGWTDQAIVTLTDAGQRDALAIRFPLAHRSTVESAAAGQGLNPSWVFAIIRQESRFSEDAASPAGAIGLMQLLPTTGRETARRLGLRLGHSRQLNQADRNVQLGTAYLMRLYRRLNDNPVLATAAYNAGPNRVRAWLPDKEQDATLWVETVPYRETRRYVRQVLASAAIYDWRRGRPVIRLERRMPAIVPGN